MYLSSWEWWTLGFTGDLLGGWHQEKVVGYFEVSAMKLLFTLYFQYKSACQTFPTNGVGNWTSVVRRIINKERRKKRQEESWPKIYALWNLIQCVADHMTQWHWPPHLTTQIPSLEPTCWKNRTNPWKLSFDLHVFALIFAQQLYFPPHRPHKNNKHTGVKINL